MRNYKGRLLQIEDKLFIEGTTYRIVFGGNDIPGEAYTEVITILPRGKSEEQPGREDEE